MRILRLYRLFAVVSVWLMVLGCAPITPVPALESTVDLATGTVEVTVAPVETADATIPATVEVTTVTTTDGTAVTYADPFAYCAAVGTVDAPDARYDGPALPDVIAETLRDEVFETPDTPLEVYQRGTYWRCLDGAVYACNVGANLPCLEKADVSREPSQEMIEYCAQNPDMDFIPAYVTGRATIYEWQCEGATPVAGETTTQVDSQGYLADYWHRIEPQP